VVGGVGLLVAGGRRVGRGSRRILIVAGIAAVVTALVYGIPPVLFAYPLPGAAIFAAAIIAMSALAICILFALRHQRSGNRTDLIIAALFGAVALIEGVLPIVAEPVGGTADIAFWRGSSRAPSSRSDSAWPPGSRSARDDRSVTRSRWSPRHPWRSRASPSSGRSPRCRAFLRPSTTP